MALNKIAGAIFNARSNGLFYNAKDYGAVGDDSTDDYAALQACLDAALVTGGTVVIPSGKYKISDKLLVDVQGLTGAPNSNIRRVSIQGEGNGNTVIKMTTDSKTCLQYIGDNPLTSASHAYITISDIAFAGASPTSRTADGLKLSDLAYLSVQNCSFHNLNAGLVLAGTLSSNFIGCVFNESATGVSASSSASGCNANRFIGCQFRQLTNLAYNGFNNTSQLLFDGCNIEGCGTHGDSTTGGIILRTAGSAGEVALTMIGCYVEGNGGGFDVKIEESGSNTIPISLISTCFNRISSSKFVTNNVLTSGSVDVNVSGCSFTGYNTYSVDAGRPYISLGTGGRLRDQGNHYDHITEAPQLGQSLPYVGFVEGSAGASVTGNLPKDWTVAQVGTGLFRVTHNLGHTNYGLVATSNDGSNLSVQRAVAANTTFDVKVVDTSDASTDGDFSFLLTEFKSVK